MKYKIKRGGEIASVIYRGTVKNGKAHGKGLMKFNGSRSFFGYFNSGVCVGYGYIDKVPVYNEGELISYQHDFGYDGQVNDDFLPNGVGFLWSPSKNTSYYGEFKDGKYHGYGRVETNNTYTYSKFEDGKAVDSLGNLKELTHEMIEKHKKEKKVEEIVCHDCAKYDGEYPTGTGVLKFINGDIYEGEYPTGTGVLKFINGDVYTGEYPTGTGVLKFINGDVYEVNRQNAKTVQMEHERKVADEKERVRLENERIVAEKNERVRLENERRVAKENAADEEERVRLENERKVAEKNERVRLERLSKIREEFKKIQFDESNDHLMKNMNSLLEKIQNKQLDEAEELLKSIQDQVQSRRSFGIKELAGVAGVAGLSYYLYNKFKKSSKRRVKSSSSKKLRRKSRRRSKHSEQSSLS